MQVIAIAPATTSIGQNIALVGIGHGGKTQETRVHRPCRVCGAEPCRQAGSSAAAQDAVDAWGADRFHGALPSGIPRSGLRKCDRQAPSSNHSSFAGSVNNMAQTS